MTCGSKSNSIWRNIMETVTFYLCDPELISSIHRFLLLFLQFVGDLTFDKILNTQKSVTVNAFIAIPYVQKVSFLRMRRWVPFEKCRAKVLKEICNHLIFKLKALVTYAKSPPRLSSPWHGEGAYLTYRFQAVHQQEELVRAMLLRSSKTNRSS